MGTRGTIILQGKYYTLSIYIHGDAYPSNVLNELRTIKEIVLSNKNRFNSISKIARLILDRNPGFEPVGRIQSDLNYLYFIFYIPCEGEKFSCVVKELKYCDTGEF